MILILKKKMIDKYLFVYSQGKAYKKVGSYTKDL